MQPLPWDEKEKYGLIKALYLTSKECITKPSRYSERILSGTGLGKPVLYAWLILTLTSVITILITWLFFNEQFIEEIKVLQKQNPELIAIDVNLIYIMFCVIFPILGLIGIFILSGLSHFTFKAIVNATVPFEAIFRIYAYAITVYIFFAFPYGQYISYPWYIFLTMIGLRTNFHCSPGKSFIVIVLPYIILFLFLVIVLT